MDLDDLNRRIGLALHEFDADFHERLAGAEKLTADEAISAVESHFIERFDRIAEVWFSGTYRDLDAERFFEGAVLRSLSSAAEVLAFLRQDLRDDAANRIELRLTARALRYVSRAKRSNQDLTDPLRRPVGASPERDGAAHRHGNGTVAESPSDSRPANDDNVRPSPDAAPTPRSNDDMDWSRITFRFISEHRVQVFVDGEAGSVENYAELGFEDRRTEVPTKAWKALLYLSGVHGVISRPPGEVAWERGWPDVEKRIQEIRRALRKRFNLSADPIPYREGAYRAAFKIERSSAFEL